jgi:hypothetical protein
MAHFYGFLTPSIVAVHGLNGHRIDTWTASNGVCWLREPNLLPAQFPTARILTYGYPAYTHTHGSNQVQHETLYGHGQALVQALTLERDEEVITPRTCSVSSYLILTQNAKKRPIIFITHSLGG